TIRELSTPVSPCTGKSLQMSMPSTRQTASSRPPDGEASNREGFPVVNHTEDLFYGFFFRFFFKGNDKLHNLLSQGQYELRVDMADFDNQTRYVKLSSISIGNEASKYKITLSGFSGNVGDSLTYINNMKFSTKDQDNDLNGGSCSVSYKGGWWYRNCLYTNPNGLYLGGLNSKNAQGITYGAWLGQSYSLRQIQLMVRRVD
ncbi:ficolin-2-like, partial [Saccostrea cucullata]|uniref:ficolin-2-like n=1 Tax=Saccostrea cuccullata TaxID=36930 RepID=UPI002ED10F5E